jgi:acetylornithine deacetylase/succinyl-diaminopimelate desuccinylase-like protein
MNLIDDVAHAAEPEAVFDDKNGCNRIAFTGKEDAAFHYAEDWSRELFQKEGLLAGIDYEIHRDPIGNVFITLYGENKEETVMSGSHLDSVPHGGKYDGAAGVISALDFLSVAVKQKKNMKRNYTVAMFRSEESSMTGEACLGSAVATGAIDRKKLNAIDYKNGGTAVHKLREQYSGRYSELLWSGVEQQLEPGNRTIENGSLNGLRRMKITLYEELHIEQSAALERTGMDVGIVTDIGGALREEVKVPKIAFETVENANDFEHLVVHFSGEAAHSGGTPPNETEDVDAQSIRFRRDALLGCAWFTREFMRQWEDAGNEKGTLKITSVGVPQRMGYTTVPPQQDLKIAVRKDRVSHAKTMIDRLKNEVAMRKGVGVAQASAEQSPLPFRALRTDQCLAALKLTEIVERIVRERNASHEGRGRVRYTVTDFEMNPDAETPLQWKMDIRHTAAAEGIKMQNEFHRELTNMLGRFNLKLPEALKKAGEANHVQLDAFVAETKGAIAELLGMKAMLMPSMPGHDARNIAKSGIRTSMTFVRHDGISHNPLESMSEADYENAKRISHAAIADELGLDWGKIVTANS